MKIERLLLITDAWQPQINGVVTTLNNTVANLERMGVKVDVIHPYLYKTFSLPFYKDIGIPYGFKKELTKKLRCKAYDSVHIAVEGRLGWFVKKWLDKVGYRYTTAFHTNFPMYLNTYFKIPEKISHALYFKPFHKKSARIMVPTTGMQDYLMENKYKNIALWSRGVDTKIFNQASRTEKYAKYILYVGRVSAEKNIEAFLNINSPHLKIVVGDGPEREKLEKKYPDAHFAGMRTGFDLARYYANAEVFVFPSLTDTFGLVIIEALACGAPVAALPASNTKDIIEAEVGCVNADLSEAVKIAATKNRNTCIEYVEHYYTWLACSLQFYNNLVTIS